MVSTKRKRDTIQDIEVLTGILKEKLNALIICFSNSWGGLEQIAANDSLALGRLDLNVRVLCLEGSPIHEHLVRKHEVSVHPINFNPRDFFDFRMRTELLRLVNEEHANLIHVHQPTLLGSVIPWFWNRRDVVLLATRHIMSDHDKRNLYHALLYRRLDAFIVMSQTLRENVLNTHPLREDQVKVIHYGLDFTQFDPEKVNRTRQRDVWGVDDETIAVGLVGRIDPAKGQETFIKAAASLLKNHEPGRKFKFIIVGEETLGSTSNYLEKLKAIAKQFRIEEHIIFACYQENIPEVMSAFDVFVMPSRQEAFGLVAIEAMAMRCPIIISNGGSADEIVGREEFGLLVRPEDAFDLQRQLRYLIDHPEIREQMGEKARKHVQDHYDRQVRLLRTMGLYERMIRGLGQDESCSPEAPGEEEKTAE